MINESYEILVYFVTGKLYHIILAINSEYLKIFHLAASCFRECGKSSLVRHIAIVSAKHFGPFESGKSLVI
jgi:hypothetical protein